ncbi:MAG: hypothetical protein AB8B53_02990 [Flavobacteriales bacterium]
MWDSLKESNYSIDYPANWDIDKSGLMGTSFILLSPLTSEVDDFRENVNLLVQDLSSYNMVLDDYVDISENQVRKMITDAEIILSQRLENVNGESHLLVYKGRQGVYELNFRQYYWVINKTAFVLTLTGKQSEVEEYIGLGQKILESFKVES